MPSPSLKEMRVNALGAPIKNRDSARGVRGVGNSILRICRAGTTVPRARDDTKARNDTRARDDPRLWFDKDFPVDSEAGDHGYPSRTKPLGAGSLRTSAMAQEIW